MGSEKLGTVPTQQIHTGLNPHPQIVFSEPFACSPQPPLRRPAATGDSGPKATTRELTACFLDHHNYFHPQPQPPQPQPPQFRHQWNANIRSSGGDATDDDDGEDDNDDDDDEDEEEEEEVENNMQNIVTVAKLCDQNDSSTANNNSHKMKHISVLGFRGGNMTECGNKTNSVSNKSSEVRHATGGEVYYSQFMNGAEGPSSSSGQKDMPMSENGCGFSGSKEGSYLSESGDSLRAILTDPLTGTLMEEAMILPCGHSFGSDGIQQIIRMKACYTCSQPVLEESIASNLSLRQAVQAFIREEESQIHSTPKRRRERYDLHKGTFGDSGLADQPRVKRVQFPFAVMDRVIIKGNKRTPPRFVGREALITTQCLNGWYVVKTLDNAESVKLQYRSLAKVSESPSSKPVPNKTMPNWL